MNITEGTQADTKAPDTAESTETLEFKPYLVTAKY